MKKEHAIISWGVNYVKKELEFSGATEKSCCGLGFLSLGFPRKGILGWKLVFFGICKGFG